MPEAPYAKADPSGVRRGWKEGANHPERHVSTVCPPRSRNPWGLLGIKYSPWITSRMLSVFGESAPPFWRTQARLGLCLSETCPSATIRPVDSLFLGALSLVSVLTLATQGLGLSPGWTRAP